MLDPALASILQILAKLSLPTFLMDSAGGGAEIEALHRSTAGPL